MKTYENFLYSCRLSLMDIAVHHIEQSLQHFAEALTRTIA